MGWPKVLADFGKLHARHPWVAPTGGGVTCDFGLRPPVIPAKAGIHGRVSPSTSSNAVVAELDSRFRGNDSPRKPKIFPNDTTTRGYWQCCPSGNTFRRRPRFCFVETIRLQTEPTTSEAGQAKQGRAQQQQAGRLRNRRWQRAAYFEREGAGAENAAANRREVISKVAGSEEGIVIDVVCTAGTLGGPRGGAQIPVAASIGAHGRAGEPVGAGGEEHGREGAGNESAGVAESVLAVRHDAKVGAARGTGSDHRAAVAAGDAGIDRPNARAKVGRTGQKVVGGNVCDIPAGASHDGVVENCTIDDSGLVVCVPQTGDSVEVATVIQTVGVARTDRASHGCPDGKSHDRRQQHQFLHICLPSREYTIMRKPERIN